MGFISYDCPRCGTRKSNFDLLASFGKDPTPMSMFGVCSNCSKGVIFDLRIKRSVGAEPHQLMGLQFHEFFIITAIQPKPEPIGKINDLPEAVKTAYSEAEASYSNRQLSAAAVMYRKAIERTLKDRYPEIKGMLNQKIRSLEAKQALPHALIELMDMVKFLGNDGAHDDDDPTPEEVERGRDFARLFLTYTYELPARIAAAKRERKPLLG